MPDTIIGGGMQGALWHESFRVQRGTLVRTLTPPPGRGPLLEGRCPELELLALAGALASSAEALDAGDLAERSGVPAPQTAAGLALLLTARVALDYLEDRHDNNNHWVWSRLPAAELDPRLAAGLAVAADAIPADPECPVCREPAISEIRVPADVHAFIVAQALSSPRAETGGILIGGVQGRRALVQRATGPGPSAVRTAAIFRRDIAFVQAELDRAATELGEQGKYIGEWHSHLTPDARASPTDVGSLLGIAGASNYLTRCPVMIIVGVDTKAGRVADLRGWSFSLGGRAAETEVAIA